MPSLTVEGGNVISTLTYNSTTTFNLATQIAAAINPLSLSPTTELTTTTISTAGPTTIPAGIVGIVIDPAAPPTTVTGSGAGLGGSGGVESVVAGSSGLTFTSAASSLDYLAIAGGTNVIGLASGSSYQLALTGSTSVAPGGGTITYGSSTVNGNGTGTIDVGSANATVEASTAGNTIFGSGSDFVVLASGDFAGLTGASPTIFGGAGPDTIALTGSTNAVFSGAASGSETVFGGLSNTLFTNGSNLVFVAGPSPETDIIVGAANSQITYFGTSSAAATISAGSGNETLNAAGASTPIDFVAGSGNTSIAAGSGNATIFGGTGANTVTGGSAADTFAFVNGQGGGSELVSNFSASDNVVLLSYGTNQVANALATSTATVVGGVAGTQITLGDNTKVTFVGTSPTASQVVGYNNGVKST